MNPVAIPQPDPLAVPAPPGLMHALLLLTFFLHLLPMNWVLGGSWIALVARAKGRAGSELHADLARRIGKSLPIAVAAAVSFGVAPLLFVQALWGRLFFPSAVLMAWWWFAVVPILIVAYYATYRVAMKGEGSRLAGTLAAAGFLAIAFLYVNNMNGMLSPQRFVERYLDDGRGAGGRRHRLERSARPGSRSRASSGCPSSGAPPTAMNGASTSACGRARASSEGGRVPQGHAPRPGSSRTSASMNSASSSPPAVPRRSNGCCRAWPTTSPLRPRRTRIYPMIPPPPLRRNPSSA